MTKKAVVLFNLGGPQSLSGVEPFLFNLFYDPRIVALPNPFRWGIAKLISRKRTPVAQEIYRQMGGKSPIVEETTCQAEVLGKKLGPQWRVFVAMRYAEPRAESVFHKLKKWEAEEVVLCPLYPQYSTTTTRSSLEEWQGLEKRGGRPWKTFVIESYPREEGLVSYFAAAIQKELEELGGEKERGHIRILFSAHGLPEKIVKKGDPYCSQVQETVAAILKKLPSNLDSLICYQSRVGPVKWTKPSTDVEIKRAGKEGKSLILVPVAFVSEHSETLVEMDIEYKHLAREFGVPRYRRVMTPGAESGFIEGLKRLILKSGVKND